MLAYILYTAVAWREKRKNLKKIKKPPKHPYSTQAPETLFFALKINWRFQDINQTEMRLQALQGVSLLVCALYQELDILGSW